MRKLRGLSQRNRGIELLEEKVQSGSLDDTDAVVYFADDDNTYDAEFLNEIRLHTDNISLFNVGLIGGFLSSGPLVEHGKVTFHPELKDLIG